MALFQTSVLKNYLKRQDVEPVAKAYKKFSKYFHNPSIQQNIRDSKEEQFQEGFLRELFVDILGYTLNPQPSFNLTTELKNEKGAKKADGAILLDGNALGVIELKSTKTKDLESIRQQAFDYKANQTGCVYVVTSNFEKLRFYINNAVEFEEFDLFTLTQNQFELLYLCLHKDNLLSNVALKIKEASVREEEVITKKFYNDYSLFKRELFRDLVKLNMKNEVYRSEFNREDTERANKNIKHNLFKKSQKLIDRFLFIFFAEDRDLLPPNSTLKILEQWNKLKDLDAYAPLYDRFKLYFGYLDTGRKGTDKGAEIFAYNGGLFKPDPILDSLQISDELLFKHTEALSKYDFESQVDVNILGHIFENSLNEIESVNAEIEGVEFDKQKTKRKKDGVFYTPKYITKYIVDNTVGKLCTEKKSELKIIDEEYTKNRKGRTTVKLKELRDQLENYRNWLLQITICDPACGSGAFLNQALDFLIKEHQYIDELQASLLGGGFVFPDIENTVLENNIFGVDLNEESVEIAKLSLWLRTAQPKRKLNDLSSNIKCGNSLIDDPKVAGNKAFKWRNEFPQIFTKGGFDVVIGNPPYVRVQNLANEDVDYYFEKYKTPIGKLDLSILFFEKSFELINQNGRSSFISSSQWMQTDYGKNLRKIIVDCKYLDELVDFGSLPVFDDANTYPAIFSFTKKSKECIRLTTVSNKNQLNLESLYYIESSYHNYNQLNSNAWNFGSFDLIKKLAKNKVKWNQLSIYGKAYYGVVTGMDKAFVVDDEIINSNNLEREIIKKYAFKGEEVNRYRLTQPLQYTIYPYKGDDMGNSILLSEHELKTNYPNVFIYLEQFKSELEQRKDSRKLYALGDKWFRHVRQGNFNLIKSDKIQIRGIGKNVLAGLLGKDTCFSGANCPAIIIENEILKPFVCLGILNSKLITNYLNSVCPKKLGGYIRYNTKNISGVPIVIPDEKDEIKISSLVNQIIDFNSNIDILFKAFLKYLLSQFKEIVITTKLQNWYELSFAEFIKELNKAIKTVGGTPLTKLQEMEWMEVFETKKAEAQTLKAEIDKTDKEIDKLVYELYGLSEEEISIVENSNN